MLFQLRRLCSVDSTVMNAYHISILKGVNVVHLWVISRHSTGDTEKAINKFRILINPAKIQTWILMCFVLRPFQL